MHEAQLPNYDRPPVVEVILGVQFQPLAKLCSAHFGAFWQLLGSDQWPFVADVPPLEPQFERFTEDARWMKVGLRMKLLPTFTSRLQMKNSSGERMIQLQNGRLILNWLGEAGGPYPRYANVRGEFVQVLKDFLGFIGHQGIGDFKANQWEITYLNHIPKGSVWQTAADAIFFKPLTAVPTIDGLIEGESFGGNWHFRIPGERGRLHVEWQHGRRSDPEKEVIVLNLTARGPVADSDEPVKAVLDGLDLGRETIVRSFKALMSDAANTYWGLKNAGH